MAEITDDIFFSEGTETVYEFYDSRNPRKDERKSWTWKKEDADDEKALWSKWYNPSNDFPSLALDVITKNNILFGVTDKKINFLSGQRVRLYREVIVEGKKRLDMVEDATVQAWLDANKVNELMHNRFMDDLWLGSNFVELVFNADGEVASIRHLDATTCRSGKKNKFTGRIDNHFIGSNWEKPVYEPKAKGEERKKNNVRRVPAFDPTNPTKYPKAIIHTKRYMPGHPYYPLPYWWPTVEWFRLASKIPAWHSFGMDNGYNIRYHVQIPKSYLEQFPQGERELKKMEIRKDMDEFLSGAKNAGKSFFSTYSNNGQLPDGWKIEPIDTKLNDEAYTSIFDNSNTAVASGLGMFPTLANLIVGNSLGNASEMRIAYQIHMALDTPRPRQRQLELLYLIAKLNKWDPSLRFGFEDIEITKLDANPTGEQNIIS
jgi:hypothetical protein